MPASSFGLPLLSEGYLSCHLKGAAPLLSDRRSFIKGTYLKPPPIFNLSVHLALFGLRVLQGDISGEDLAPTDATKTPADGGGRMTFSPLHSMMA
jgi:hypothetical protein